MHLWAGEDPEALVKAIGRDLMLYLKEQGRTAAREIVMEANRQRVSPEDLPYVFWVLASQKELPDLRARQKVFTLMIDIMARTGTMPNYQRAFRVADDIEVDAAVDKVAVNMALWAAKNMIPFLIHSYLRVLAKYAGKVPAVTGEEVPASNGLGYLNTAFREVLTLRSTWFEDGELLRRVVRFIPEW